MGLPIREGMVGDFYFYDHVLVRKQLACRIRRGELAVVLGAGVSQHAGFPLYGDFVSDLRSSVGLSKLPGLKRGDPPLDLKQAVEEVRRKIKTDTESREGAQGGKLFNEEYKEKIRLSLYKATDDEYEQHLTNSSELAALSALTVTNSGSRVNQIITYNLDTYLEDYLRFQGVKADRVPDLPVLRRSDRVQIYHPHGFIDRDGAEWSRDFVLSTSEYSRREQASEVMHKAWHQKIENVFYEQQGLFIGLSGKPDDFTGALSSVYLNLKATHSVDRAYVGYWLYPGKMDSDVYDDVRQTYGCMPVTFEGPAEMWRFVHSLRGAI